MPIGLAVILAADIATSAPPPPAPVFSPGNLIVSRSVYQGTSATIAVNTPLPPNCTSTQAKKSNCVKATNDGTYPTVFQNDLVDGSFGVTSPIFLDQVNPTTGVLVGTLPVPASGPNPLVTSFSSKSELALNLSQDGTVVTFMGYAAPVNAIDVSNSNTPGVVDPTNPVGENFSRVIGQVDAFGNFQTTLTNAYSGNNGRAAALANGFYYMTGNSNNGSGTPANVVAAAGAQIAFPGQTAGAPQEIGTFSILQVPNANGGQLYTTPDKLGKDNNFRGLTIFNNTLFVTKGSGGNGINTVYQVGNAGTLPTTGNAANAPIAILPGFPTTLASAAGAMNPFGLWFANATTLYVADEGDGNAADAATSRVAGLQKWTFANGVWQLDYVLQNGLNLGQPYSVTGTPAYPNPATDGLRNITGRVNADGTVTIWAITSTISASGDQGADPNKLVTITDNLLNTNPAAAAGESFVTLRTANYGEVLRGVSFTPGTPATAAFVGLDTATMGNWKNTYGADGEVLAGDANAPASYVTVHLPTASTFVWAASGIDPRFLEKAASATDRIAATYYSQSTFAIDLDVGSSLHQVAFYLLDEDTSSRRETITIVDAASGRVLDSRLLTSFHNGLYAVYNLQGHVLVEVANSGGSNAVISGIFFGTASPLAPLPTVGTPSVSSTVSLIAPLSVMATAGAGATISAVQFFANGTAISPLLTGVGPTYSFQWPTTTLPNGSYNVTAVATDSEGQTVTSSAAATAINNTVATAASFVAADTATEGTWKGAYGAAGDLIAFDSFVLPPYALASFNQGPAYLWGTTGATQAMQRLSAPGRIASAWFGTLTFSLDVNFADGQPHQLSLYFLDWDHSGRAETVNVIDANPNATPQLLDSRTISNFGLGEYLTWNVTGHVLIQFNKTAGSSAVVNGVFFNQ